MKTAPVIPSRILAFLFVWALWFAGWEKAAAASGQVFAGRDLKGLQQTGAWGVASGVSLDPSDPTRFIIRPGVGIYVNGAAGRTTDLMTEAEYGDVEVHVEFCIPRHSNSGVYLMGRYEVQVYDSFGVEKDKYPGIECGGIYPRWTEQRGEYEGHSPRVNASKPPGQWQSFDIVFRAPRFDSSGRKTADARFVKVVHNGQVVHENVSLTGPTRAAKFGDERPIGPLVLQGDHGPVAYRNLRLTSVDLK